MTDIDWIHPISEAFIEGAQQFGMPRNPDYNGASQQGVGYFQRTIDRGLRMSTARTFLRPAQRRKTLSVRTNSQATQVLFEGRRAVGVAYRRGGAQGSQHEVRARREVILCAGAINTPRLLQLSGVGPAAWLQDIGVPVVLDLPGVGNHLKDHFSIRVVARVDGASGGRSRAGSWSSPASSR